MQMNESVGEIERLIQEIVAHLSSGTKMDARKAVVRTVRLRPFWILTSTLRRPKA